MSKTMIGFYHGALADPYEVQARKQGYTLGSDADLMQKLGDGLVINFFHGILTDAMYNKACWNLQNKIVKHLKKIGGEK